MLRFTNTHKHSYRVALVITIVVLLLALAGYTLWRLIPQTSSQNSAVDQQKQAQTLGSTIKQQSIQNAESSSTKQTNGSQQTNDTQSTISITGTNQSPTTFSVRTVIDKVIGSGTCTITLTHQTTKVTHMVDIQPLATTSTCKGFDIPLSQLSVGTWETSITFSGGGFSGSTTTQVEIR